MATNMIVLDYQVSTNSLCFTWASTPGLYYYVQGATDSTGTNWTNISRTLVATDFQTSFCIPVPSPFQSFLIQQGIPPGANLPLRDHYGRLGRPGRHPVGVAGACRQPIPGAVEPCPGPGQLEHFSGRDCFAGGGVLVPG